MIIPIRTSIHPERTPYVNYALIAINILIFLLTFIGQQRAVAGDPIAIRFLKPVAEQFMLHPNQPRVWQFVTYAFLHGGLMHVFGNMYFLYLFGNNVNAKLGNLSYLCLYLGGAVFAGVGHALLHSNPVLGASGAVAAITGAYLVLFPQTVITVLYWFIFIGTMEISALYFILFKLIVWDNIVEPRFSFAAVAYDAHLAGYFFGAGAIIILLATGLVRTQGFDLWTMMKQWNRRRRYRDAVSDGYDPYTGRLTKPVKAKQPKPRHDQQTQQQIDSLRSKIAQRIAERNVSAAAQLYLKLIEIDDTQIPPQQYLLDIANQLASESLHVQAARAYEHLLTHYAKYDYIEQVQLMLGIIYSRYLDKPDLAIKHLQPALDKLTDEGQKQMCKDELEKLQS